MQPSEEFRPLPHIYLPPPPAPLYSLHGGGLSYLQDIFFFFFFLDAGMCEPARARAFFVVIREIRVRFRVRVGGGGGGRRPLTDAIFKRSVIFSFRDPVTVFESRGHFC